MDATLPQSTSPTLIATVNPAAEVPSDRQKTTTVAKRKNVKKKQASASDSASYASSSNFCCATSYLQRGIKVSGNPRKIRFGPLRNGRKSVDPSDVDALGLPLGMSIAAVVSQVLERKNAAGEKMSADHLCDICILAVRESLKDVFSDKFDNFVTNFEKSFRSTLVTLRLINHSSQNVGEKLQRPGFPGKMTELLSLNKPKDSLHFPELTDEAESHNHGNQTNQHQKDGYQENPFAEVSTLSPRDQIGESACMNGNPDGCDSLSQVIRANRQCYPHKQMDENRRMNLMNQQLVLHNKQIDRLLTSSSNSGINQSSMLTTIEKSVIEQTRSNDLKAFEISLIMKKLQLKEKQLEMGFSKASFKSEKFKTQLQDLRQVELLRKCLDFLVAGLVIILFSILYGTYAYSHRRIIEATEACSPYTESKSWWMPKSMSAFNSGLKFLKCQFLVYSRMFFGVMMIAAVIILLIQRPSVSHQTMPITFMLVLLGFMCGSAGKFCIDALGGSGYHWLIYWEALCLLHFFSNTFGSTLFFILNGPIMVAERVEHNTPFPYWMRKSLFFATLVILPLLCGFMPFASPREWVDHFSSKTSDFVTFVED